MSTQQRILCGVPDGHCQGSHIPTSRKWAMAGKPTKGHTSREDARRCYLRYMTVVMGYERTQDGKGLFKGDGPVLVVARLGHFGALMRKGKAERFMPADHTSGTIINH